MAVSAPSQALIALAFTPESIERAIRDMERAAWLLDRFGDLTTDQSTRDVCLTMIARLRLLAVKMERAWEAQIGIGEG